MIALATALAACGGSAASAAPGASVTPASPSAAVASGPDAEFLPIELGGEGNDITPISIPVGATVIATFQHLGDEDFIVDTVAVDGSLVENLVDAVGPYAGTVLLDDREDDHAIAFRIVASGAWTGTVTPATQARSWDGVGKIDGRGDDVLRIDPPTLGVTPWHVEHEGGSTFVVDAYAGDGQTNVISEIGAYEGDIRVVGGTYLLTVRSEGTWSFYVLM